MMLVSCEVVMMVGQKALLSSDLINLYIYKTSIFLVKP